MVEENRGTVKELLERSQTAKSALQIWKELPKLLTLTRKGLPILLEDMIAAGEIFIWPGKRYWNRDPRAEAQHLVFQYLSHAGVVSAARVKTALRLPLEAIDSTLKGLVAEGRLHIWQPGKTAQYCLFDPQSAAQETILKALAAGPLTEKELVHWIKKRLAGYNAKNLKQHVSPLLQSRQVFDHPKYGGTKARYGLKPPEPDLYLVKAKTEIETVHRLLAPSGVSLETVFRALGEHIGLMTKPSAREKEKPEDRMSTIETERLILEGITRLQPLGQSRALVSIRELRRLLTLTKNDFDQAVFSLAVRGRVALHQHDFPGSLSPDEREEMVRDDRGTYYVGIVPKEGS
jgi:hypothetical protein